MSNIKVGSFVVTSRGRYGTIAEIDTDNTPNRYKVKIGYKFHWIFSDNVWLVSNVIHFKVEYEANKDGGLIIDRIQVPMKKDSILYSKGFDVHLEDIIKAFIERSKDVTGVVINSIKIS